MHNKPTEIKSLTGIRFFAAFHVLVFHALYLSGSSFTSTAIGHALVSHGDAAVIFFFVLSGFILTYVYGPTFEHTFSKRAFWTARIARIYPVYLFSLLLDLPNVAYYFFQQGVGILNAVKFFGSGLLSVLMLQAWHPRTAYTWNSPAWSLSNEAFFYFLFPFVAVVLWRIAFLWRLLLAVLFFLLPLLLYFFGSQFVVSPEQHLFLKQVFASSPLVYCFSFLIGVVLGTTYRKQVHWFQFIQERSFLFGVLFWLVVFLSFVFASIEYSYSRAVHMLGFLLPCFVFYIVCLAGSTSALLGVFRNRFVHFLGQASYSLYIIHLPVLTYYLFLQRYFGWGYSWPLFIGYVFLAVGIACLVFLYIEQPMQRWVRKLLCIKPRNSLS